MSRLQVLEISRCRCGFFIDMTVFVELASRIQDLLYNESYELLRHGHDPIHMENFLLDWHHHSEYITKTKIEYTILCNNYYNNYLITG
jgi:hypothetical protein